MLYDLLYYLYAIEKMYVHIHFHDSVKKYIYMCAYKCKYAHIGRTIICETPSEIKNGQTSTANRSLQVYTCIYTFICICMHIHIYVEQNIYMLSKTYNVSSTC